MTITVMPVVPGMHRAEPVIPVKAEETKLLVAGRAFPIDRAFLVQMFLMGVFGEEKGGRKQNRLTGFCCFFWQLSEWGWRSLVFWRLCFSYFAF